MTSDWAGKRVHVLTDLQRTEIEQARNSGTLHLEDFTRGSHYLTRYTYNPKGFWALFPGLQGSEVSLNSEVQALDIEARKILVNGQWSPYENLVSTIPLDQLLRIACLTMFDSSRILVTSFMTLNIVVATNQAQHEHEAHWLYLYDDDIPVARVSFPDRFIAEPALQGPRHLRIQGEAYFLRDVEDSPKVTPIELFDYLKGHGLIPSDSVLIYQAKQSFDYGNVVPTLGSEGALASIKNYLSSNGIYVAGRYGAWEYLWTLEAARSGFEAAEKLISTRGVLLPATGQQ